MSNIDEIGKQNYKYGNKVTFTKPKIFQSTLAMKKIRSCVISVMEAIMAVLWKL